MKTKLNKLINCSLNIKFRNIKINSKYIKKGDLFLLFNHDKNDILYINDAINKKCSAIITDKNINVNTNVPIIKTDKTMYDILSKYYNVDYNTIKLIGITGTDGKTTTATIIYDLLSNFLLCSYLGTNGFKLKNKTVPTKNTTPSLKDILKYIKITKNNNAHTLVMEVSSEGLFYNRCDGLFFDIAILTNITKDHLNTHKTVKNYVKCKSELFKKIKENGYAIINIDDKHAKYILKKCNSNTITYGLKNNSKALISDIMLNNNNSKFKLTYLDKTYYITSPLLGLFNIYNLVAAIMAIHCLNIKIEEIIKYISKIKQIEGRLEYLNYKVSYNIIVDYAHTINATKNVLKFLSSIKEGNIITVVGCAGGRDKTKRNKIGKIVTDLSDHVILTTDDPRNEDPNEIVKQMIKKVKKNNYSIILDREKAINKALSLANIKDTVLILGKGNDNYMAIGNEYIPYSDKKTINKILDRNI